ncbi:MAG: hypothetical protein IJ391_02465 [Clostridia bacterium]|nr:hypothetical protein [Clostridia bacterium]
MSEMIKYEYDVFWFDIELESGYTVTVGGRETGDNIHLQIKIDGNTYYSYEQIVSEID